MSNALGIALGVGLGALALGGTYLLTQNKAPDNNAELEVAKLRNEQLQWQLEQERQNTQQVAQAPVSAPPTQQGQQAGRSVSSVLDGIFGIVSLFGEHD